MLIQEQVAFYHTNGYIVVEEVILAEEIAELRRVTDEFIEKSRQVTEHTSVFDLEPGHTPEAPRLRRLKSPATQHPVYDRILRDDCILDMVAQLIGPAICHQGGKLNMKSAEFGSPVEWHQDFAFGSDRTNDDMLSVGVAIDDMTQENGCLLFIPGSHKGEIYDHYQSDVFVGAITDTTFKPDNVVPIEVKAGGITIHHTRTLHASAPNTTGQARRLLLLQYAAADAWSLSAPPTDWDAFNAAILRGEPVREPRYADIPPVPRPATIRPGRSGSIYEQQTLLQQRLLGKSC